MIWFSLGFASGEGLETCPVFSFSKGTVITAGPFLMAYCNQPRLCWWRWLLFCSDAYVLLAWCRSTCLQLQGSYGKTRGRDQIPRSFCPASLECAAVNEGPCLKVESEDQYVYLQACTCTCAPPKTLYVPTPKMKKAEILTFMMGCFLKTVHT